MLLMIVVMDMDKYQPWRIVTYSTLKPKLKSCQAGTSRTKRGQTRQLPWMVTCLPCHPPKDGNQPEGSVLSPYTWFKLDFPKLNQ